MKKVSKSLMLSLAFVLTACGGSVDSSLFSSGSSETVGPDGSSSSSEVIAKPATSAEEVLAFLKEVGKKGNYTLDYSVDSKATYNEVVYHENYIYYQSVDAGYLRLQSYEGDGKSLLYNFQGLAAPKVENAVAYNYNDERIPVRDTMTLNALAVAASKEDVTIDDLYTQDRWTFYATKDPTLIEGFAYLVGAQKLIGSIGAITLALDPETKALSFHTETNFANAEDAALLDGIYGTISKVGETALPALDSFVGSYALPSVVLDETALDSIKGEIGYKTRVDFYYDAHSTADKMTLEQEDTVSLKDGRKDRVRMTDGSLYGDFLSLSKGKDGKAIESYVGYDNKVHDDTLTEDYDALVFAPSDTLERQAFLGGGDGTFSYYGYDGRAFATKLFDFDPGEIYSVSLTVSEGKIASLEAISTTRYDSYGQKMYYRLTATFGLAPSFQTLASHADPGDVYFTYGALGNLYPTYSDLNYSFKATIHTDTGSASKNYDTRVYVFNDTGAASDAPNVVLFDRDSVDTSEGAAGDPIHIVTGYKKVGNKTIRPFRMEEDGTLLSSGPDESRNLKDVLGMDLSANLFEKVEETETEKTWRAYPDVKRIEEHILGGPNKGTMVPSSLTLISAKDSLTTAYGATDTWTMQSLSYEFRSDFYRGIETVSFEGWSKTAAPEGYDLSTVLPWVEPTSWKTGAKNVYPELVTLFGEELASSLPFLYDKDLEGHWGVDTTDDGTYKWAALFNDTYAASDEDPSGEYMRRFESHLRELGFVDTDEWPMGGDGAKLVKDGLYVRVGTNAMSGLRFLIKK